MKKIRYKNLYFLFCLVGLSTSPLSYAKTMSLTLENGLEVNAEFRKGDPNKPAVLVVHGFLQTEKYLTLTNIKEAVIESEHTMLAPTLSLGVGLRRVTLACEAKHHHKLSDDLAEIAVWMKWLKAKGYKRVILIGHSFGSVVSLAYLSEYKHSPDLPVVDMMVGVSLTDTELTSNRKRRDNLRQLAKKRMRAGDNKEYMYSLSYCNRYKAPSQSYLSYANWSSEQILKVLRKLSGKTRIVSILGSRDKRVPGRWPEQQRKTGIEVRTVKGANHFFGGEHQFDLLNTLEDILDK